MRAALRASAVLLLSGAAHAQGPAIKVEPVFGGGFLLAITTDREDLAAARAMLEPRARELCKERTVRWGRFQFTAQAIVVPPGQPASTRMEFTQQISCESGNPLRRDVAPAPTPEATQKDRQSMERINAAFFAARDRGDANESFRLAGEKGLASFSSLSEWREQVNTFVQLSGGQVRREWRKWTWYRDPEGAEPGLYVAVDFVAESRNLAALCGYALWKRRANGSFDLTRLEENTLTREEIPRFWPDELEATLKRFRCK